MVLYNVTMNVEKEIESEWLQWMKETHVKDVMNTGYFIECKIFQLLSEEPQGTTYAFQYFAKSAKDIQTYQDTYGAKLQMDVISRYGDKVMSFRTLLKQVL
ncbi:DUF4286 family protein [Reichenbachiella agarivorans]|uniref:DUF4286 family protein n=1 Tax=Reichenbachiella agarivorans TaxID=2979464 RepID=A0ABY6CUB0_9BACT|nr:DUF4286 family protein [Reichenbachiella agarivorans]UXP33580.1 DUF4286 family protein [Reichenbachiella agarivorans]